ncbi:hypothetical protein OQ252_10775 [Acetobacter farinalis]|uniref:Uncharacterized protein n=1 Tax=Acetobacter farinalis TaxID=1260984 RepID=A0ABT3Q9B0_9PROT|nr:hypothetical protein [Acetobacter farinalis]MCX2561876.1 hypothetical protein [Acetobacter farinalis]NHO30366.1 hypothetical protein [Acetobacter farinalis]
MEQMQAPGTPKGLMAAVIGMGILIVVGTGALVGVIIHRMGAHTSPATLAASAPAGGEQISSTTPLPLPAGSRLVSMTHVQDDLLALHILENGKDRILLWQVSSGRVRPGLDIANLPALSAP